MQGARMVFVMVMGLLLPVLAHAQSTEIFPVHADVSQVRTDLITWGTALIGVALAIFAYRKVKSIAR